MVKLNHVSKDLNLYHDYNVVDLSYTFTNDRLIYF